MRFPLSVLAWAFQPVEYAAVLVILHLPGQSASVARWGAYRGWRHADAGHHRRAVTYGKIAVECDPTWPGGYRTLGYAYQKVGGWSQARVIYRQGLAADPRNVDLWYQLGTLEFEQERYKEAEEAYRSAARSAPDDPSLLLAVAQALLAQDRYAEALAQLRRAQRLGVDTPRLDRMIGTALSMLDDDEAALPILERAVEREPDSPHAHQSLAVTLGALGRWAEAAQHAARAAQLAPDEEVFARFASSAQAHAEAREDEQSGRIS